MSKQIHFSPAQLCQVKKMEAEAINSSNKAHLLITLAILIDCCEWPAEDINWFTDKYEEFLNGYNKGEEDLDVLNKNIFEYSGVAIMDVKEQE